MKTNCSLVTLASTPVAKVERCEHCDVIAVHIGVFSFRLDPAAFEDLCDALGGALERLQATHEDARHRPVSTQPRGLA